MGAERGECLGEWRVLLPQEGGLGLLGRIETCGGNRLSVIKIRPAIPSALLDAHQVIGIVEWVSTAADISAMERSPQLLVAIELQAERVSQSRGDELEIRTIRIEPDDRPSTFDIAFYDFAGSAPG